MLQPKKRVAASCPLVCLYLLAATAFGLRAAEAPAVGTAVDPALSVGPRPAWVEDVAWTLSTGKPPVGVAGEILLADSQDNLTTHGSDFYFHQVVRVLSASAVNAVAHPTNQITPEFERVTWHTLTIHRDGQPMDRLPTTEFKKLQRELALEEQMLTGETTYAAVLSDVRVGDVVETAYTLHYHNPLFDGQLTARHDLGAMYPVRHERIVIHLPEGGPRVRAAFLVPEGTYGLPDALYRIPDLQSALTDESLEPSRLLRWEARDLEAIKFDGNLPGKAFPYWPRLRLTSFMAWSDVVAWAEPLFVFSSPLPDPLPALLKEWQMQPEPEQRLAAAVRWVQNDVRYFALEFGQQRLRPRPLAEVCATRYGDCKDKSLLLVALLRGLGIEAWPTLVSTQWRDRLHRVRPDPNAFNHAVVAYRLGTGPLRWIDPTIKHQQGQAGKWAFPPYRTGLLVRPGQNDLVDIPAAAAAEPTMMTLDRITLVPDSTDATLATEATLTGIDADYFRQRIDSISADERSKGWFNFIARFYRRLEEVEAPVVVDDAGMNKITIRAKYRLPGFVRTDGEQESVVTYAYAIRSILDLPDTRRRQWPYALPSDKFVRHRIEVELPFDMPAQQQPELVRTEGLEFRLERSVVGRRWLLQYDLRVTGDFVAAEHMGRFCDSVEGIMESLGMALQKPAAKAPPSSAAQP
ncbi:DUF3857 domain-containing protein [Opitutus sp. ER46]|uniref:DUF3857 domain-containing protein n=1 Tax=Opitutus sp. ER46 TaxID=2161864 RepID=UPI001304F2AE|nr:DUF3857 domain-containing protein [Opitutus sp. ER46]